MISFLNEYFTHDLIEGIIFFQIVVLIIVFSNIIVMHSARLHRNPRELPFVSVLVPARNEEKNIAWCVQSLLGQNYPLFEVIVLDDQSTDHTKTILEEISRSDLKLKVVDGSPPSGNLVGKNWACSQLSRHARGDVLVFTDADTFHHAEALKTVITTLLAVKADFVTGFPRQIVHTWGERLLVPFFSWASYCYIPMGLAYLLQLPVLSIAVGQLMVFRREAYEEIGGHDAVKGSIVEDLVLARRIKEVGRRWRVMYVSDLISCRMYHESQEAFNGFVKNLFAAFDFRLLPFLFIFVWLAVVFWLPLMVIFLWVTGNAPQTQIVELVVSVVFSLLIWVIPFLDMRAPFGLAFLYPFIIFAIEFVALQSLRRSLSGRLSWKGREISKPNWKWF